MAANPIQIIPPSSGAEGWVGVWVARPINRLSVRQISTLKPGYHCDGGGLYLQVTPTMTRSWIFRYKIDKRPRDMGMGVFPTISLQDARERAALARRQLAEGVDPLAAKRAGKAMSLRLWGSAVDDFIDIHKSSWKTAKGGKTVTRDGVEMGTQENQWRQSLEDYGPDRKLPVSAIDTNVILACLKPLWKPRDQGGKTETATRVRGRIEKVWDAERVAGNVTGENPARWKGHMQHLLPNPEKLKQKRHHPALPFEQAPALYAALRDKESISARALRFLLLTAARTQEVTGLPNLSEIDFKKALWLVPGERMKAEIDHEVPLVPEAIELLRGLNPKKPPFPLSENTMLFFLQRDPPKGLGFNYTVHGLRSTFRDWVSEKTDFPREVAEMSIAHQVKDKTEAAYRRRKLVEKRRELMTAWAAYLAGG